MTLDVRRAVLAAMSDDRPRALLKLLAAQIPACRAHLPHTWQPCGAEWHPRLGWYTRRAYWCPRCRTAFEVDDLAAFRTWTVTPTPPPRERTLTP